jgi:hypothetical protein
MSARMRMSTPQPPPAADAASALVVFLMPSDRVLANAIVDETGRAYGELPPQSRLIAAVPPGPHTFIKALYKNPGNGDFALWGHLVCNQLSGLFEAGRIYFVEMSVWRLFVVKPNDPRLAGWAAAPSAELDPAKGAASVAGDPEWSKCVAQAGENAANEHNKQDQRSVVTASDGMTRWP